MGFPDHLFLVGDASFEAYTLFFSEALPVAACLPPLLPGVPLCLVHGEIQWQLQLVRSWVFVSFGRALTTS